MAGAPADGTLPFGRWPSPLTVETVAAGRRSRSGLASDGTHLYWLESRPQEGGRQVLVRALPDGDPEDVSPPGTSLRSRVHEYGGGAYCLLPGTVAYVDQSDQRIHLLRPGAEPVALTPDPPAGTEWRHGDLWAAADGRWVLAVREAHAPGGISRSVVALDVAAPGQETVLCSGRDFFAAPRPDPFGHRLAWVCWDHPDMSWDASEVWVADLRWGPDGRPGLSGAQRIAGGRDAGESVGQPTWTQEGSLLFVSDAGGWWQPWRWSPEGTLRQLTAEAAEFHGPDWQLGQATLAELADGAIACRRQRQGIDQLGLLDPASGTFEAIEQPCVAVEAVCVHRGRAAWLGATSSIGTAPWWDGPAGPAPYGSAGEKLTDPADVSVAEPYCFDGPRSRVVHGLFYPPLLRGVRGPEGVRPPLVVVCHGGPTGNAGPGFDPIVQLLTTRGYAVTAVDYAGSTGYGRAYRRALWGEWGIADVDDCIDAARHLAAVGRVDGNRLAIRGGSSGGLTALDALVRSDAFAAAVSWYGVTDLLALAATTHDFESHYLDRLIGPLPEAVGEYRRRSPVHLVGQMSGAVLVLQGLDDPVVPPEQATAMVETLTARGVRCEYLAFPGESHGFRRSETLETALRAELAFYEEVLCPQ